MIGYFLFQERKSFVFRSTCRNSAHGGLTRSEWYTVGDEPRQSRKDRLAELLPRLEATDFKKSNWLRLLSIQGSDHCFTALIVADNKRSFQFPFPVPILCEAAAFILGLNANVGDAPPTLLTISASQGKA
jgi:hypothetical protein